MMQSVSVCLKKMVPVIVEINPNSRNNIIHGLVPLISNLEKPANPHSISGKPTNLSTSQMGVLTKDL